MSFYISHNPRYEGTSLKLCFSSDRAEGETEALMTTPELDRSFVRSQIGQTRSTVSCLMSTISYLLSIIWPSAVCCLLSAVCCLLSNVCLSTVCYLFSAVYRSTCRLCARRSAKIDPRPFSLMSLRVFLYVWVCECVSVWVCVCVCVCLCVSFYRVPPPSCRPRYTDLLHPCSDLFDTNLLHLGTLKLASFDPNIT
jgi:hypothetical protein